MISLVLVPVVIDGLMTNTTEVQLRGLKKDLTTPLPDYDFADDITLLLHSRKTCKVKQTNLTRRQKELDSRIRPLRQRQKQLKQA